MLYKYIGKDPIILTTDKHIQEGDTIVINSNTISRINDIEVCIPVNNRYFMDVHKSSLINISNKPEKEYTEEYMEDIINHPYHYSSRDIECIDAMEAAYGTEAVINFCMCNAFKYQWRFNKKNGIEDIKKCQWYQNKMIELKNKLKDSKTE